MMRWVRRQGLHYLQFPQLSGIDGLEHGIFLRFHEDHGALPRSFNLGLGCGERDERVWDRRRSAAAVLGMDAMIFARQVHGADVRLWPPSKNGDRQAIEDGQVHLAGDALVTGAPGQALFIQTADCQSVLVADPRKGVVANIHSGWRGSVANIIGRTIQRMVRDFGCRPGDLHCGIGPSLGPCCAEFIHYREEIPERYWPYKLSGRRFDFWRISLDQLAAEGVEKAHVETSHICTRCNPNLFYSYRAEGAGTGRFAAVIGIRR